MPRKPGRRRWLRGASATLAAIGLSVAAIAWRDTFAEPVVREATVPFTDFPSDTPPLRIALLADLHVAGPDMPPQRLAGIVDQVNQLAPDIVLLAGDFISDKRLSTHAYSFAQALAPLGGLKPRLGSVAVLGNHDHWRNADAARRELVGQGVAVLANSAMRLGPLTIGGLDDDFTGRADLPATLAAMRHLGGPFIMLSHTPDPFPDLPAQVPLMVAGHTHCGQIRFPWGGAPATMSRHGDRYACGRIVERGRTLIVSAGLGTSILPIRFGAKSDIWIITIGP